jgi:ribosomal protein S18 acetylase RimI-like enzyme
MTITYRTGQVSDAGALDRLFDQVFCDTFGHLYAAEDLHAFLTSYGVVDWERDLESRECAFRVAEDDGRLVGYAKLGPVDLPIQASPSAILLEQIYVVSSHHGAGIASTLMDWVIEEAKRRGSTELYLTVFVDNPRARRFYDRYGFDPVGRYDFMVGNHADEDVIMRKAL